MGIAEFSVTLKKLGCLVQ